MSLNHIIFYTIIFICFITSIYFVYHNYAFYERPIAKVIQTNLEDSTDLKDIHGNEDRIFTQHIIGEIKNGEEKGRIIHLTNEYSLSGAYDQPYEKGNELFVSFEKNPNESSTLTGNITDVKRDKYTVIVAWIFIFTLLLVGKKQGLFASISLAVNILLLSYALDIYVRTDMNLLWICGITVVLFTVISLLLVNGFNEKTYAAIIATLLGTFISLLITYLAMRITSENGLYYEEMQYLTRPYRLIFLAGLFIGSLGAVMDVAISLSSATFELYNKNNDISVKALKESGIEIGKDIMGTMTNILFFAYISGSIPMLILYLKNYSLLGFTLSINLSLELARALAGGIGIVLTIPIGLYTSIFFINRKREKL
ncbi:YibE/F family protein [Oceanobacillus sp. Castelsardo]|uniref:YibE/F family protein n=1 Tax=Oceanobacillus sp. Castelsardo TaxID=1851204 RepID=UPI0012E8311B|nr:YibE/F family protein [Oceanobacillus sp. Castelsardo]